jgi:hypothetical protein
VLKTLRKHFIVVSVPFAHQNECGAGVKVRAYTADHKKLHEFDWGTDRGFTGLPYREWQHEANVKRVQTFLEECLKKTATPSVDK